MRPGLVAIVVLLGLAGCIRTEWEYRRGGIYLGEDEIPLLVPQDILTEGPQGLLIYRLDNPVNLTVDLRYAMNWSEHRLNPLIMMFLFDDGSVRPVGTLHADYKQMEDERGVRFRSDALAVERAHALPGPDDRTTIRGTETHFHPQRGGWFIVGWANVTDQARVELNWLEGTTLREVHRSDRAGAFDLSHHEEGTLVTSPWFHAASGSSLNYPAEGEQLFGTLKLYRGMGSGSAYVRDDAGTRELSVEDASAGRAVFTAEGSTTVGVDHAGVEGLRLITFLAPMPPGTLPERAWAAWEMSS